MKDMVWFFAGIAGTSFAQAEKKQSFFFSVCLFPKKYTSAYMHDCHNVKRKAYEAIFGDYGYKAVGYDNTSFGTWEIAYYRHISRQVRLNANVFCDLDRKHWDLYDEPEGPRTKNIWDYRFALLSGIDYLCTDYQQIKLYFTGQIGLDWIHRGLNYFDAKERNKYYFAWQMWGTMERRMGVSLSVNFAVGYGTEGILKLGLGYHF